jgi:hypothetical protein
MHRYIIRLLSMTAGLLIITGCASLRPAHVQTTRVGFAINEAKAGIEEYLRSEDAKRAGISLKTADFTFKVTAIRGGAGMGANILVFRARVAPTGQNVEAVTYHYGKSAMPRFTAPVRPPTSMQFTDAIRRAVKEQIPRTIATAPVSEITIGLDFGVELKHSAGAAITIAAPVTITVGPSVTFSRNDVQYVKLVFAITPRPSSPRPG